jgi:glutamate dehydrogenase (NADP+)
MTAANAARVVAPTVVEIANGPVTSDADAILRDKGTVVVPDVLANAGGVTVSYFEWVQNRAGSYWRVEEVHQKLRETMSREFNAVFDLAQERGCDPRTAAYVQALGRIGAAIESQGTHAFFRTGSRGPTRPSPISARGNELGV